MVQALEILKGYITCEDEATRNKFFNLLDSFWHKEDGMVLKDIVIGQNGDTTFNFLDKDGNTSVVTIPALPNSMPISFIRDLQDKLNALQPKEAGKGLSANDLTTDLLNKLTGLENYVHPEYHQIAEVFGLTDALAGKADAPPEGYGFSQENYSLPEKTDVAKIPDHEIRIGKLEGMDLIADMANQKILVKNSVGDLISEISVAWLNNEGTVFSYNATTEKLELKNDAGDLLAEVPVSAFVSNLANSLSLTGNALQLKDTEGNVISSVSLEISNINGLLTALNEKSTSVELARVTQNFRDTDARYLGTLASDYSDLVTAIGSYTESTFLFTVGSTSYRIAVKKIFLEELHPEGSICAFRETTYSRKPLDGMVIAKDLKKIDETNDYVIYSPMGTMYTEPAVGSLLNVYFKPYHRSSLSLAPNNNYVSLRNPLGITYHFSAPSAYTMYIVSGLVPNGCAIVYINVPTEPTIQGGATKVSGSVFAANTTMKLIIFSPDGEEVQYYFEEI